MSHVCKAALAAMALVCAVAAPAVSATLTPVNLADPKLVVQDDGVGAPETVRLFSTEVKRDHMVNNPGRAGNDVFLRNGSNGTLGSASVNWGPSGSEYDWSLSYDGTVATLTVAGQSVTSTVTSGTWNVFSFFLRADDTTRFSSSTVTLSTTSANGAALTVPVKVSTTNSQFSSLSYALDGFTTITTLAGKLRWDFALISGAKGSPNSRLSLSMTATKVTPVTGVPVPGSLSLLLGAVAGLSLVRRRVLHLPKRDGASAATISDAIPA